MKPNFYRRSLVIGCILGFIFMTTLAWANDVLVTMLIGKNWEWAMEKISVTTFTGFTVIHSVPRVALFVETVVFIWKNLIPWLCALCAFIGAYFFENVDKKQAVKKALVFGLVTWGFTWCWFSIEDWWGFFLRNLFPSVDPLHTLPVFSPYGKLGHPYDINVYGKWVPIWQYIGYGFSIGLAILIFSYLVWRFICSDIEVKPRE